MMIRKGTGNINLILKAQSPYSTSKVSVPSVAFSFFRRCGMGRYRPDGQDLLVDLVGDKEIKPVDIEMLHEEVPNENSIDVVSIAITYGDELRSIINYRQLLHGQILPQGRHVGHYGKRAEVGR